MERLRRKNTSQDESPRKKRKDERCFQINEKILCYEPDSKLERVLYDAKIREVHEILKKGKKCFEYLVHFQGWNSSWDRRVNEDFILKDTPENRKLQRDLAEKNQLQLGAYLYRKERKKRKKMNERKMLLGENLDETKKSEDQNDFEHEYYSSSATESHDDDRIFLHIGEHLKSHLEFDNFKVTKEKNYAKLPAKLPILAILENFVKSYAIKVVTAPQQEQVKPKRRSSILGIIKKEHKVKSIDYEAISNNIDLCKEVADGLRVYFNFILKDFLLYTEEKEEYERIMSEENLKDFQYDPGEPLMLDNFFSKSEPFVPIPENQQQPETPENLTPSLASEKRISTRLRSHSLKTDDDEKPENLSSMASTSSNDSLPIMELHRKGIFSKEWKPLNSGLTSAAYKIIEEVFNWRMVGDDSNPEPSMIFGIYHLSRLVVKLPEFLSATPMNEEKMALLLKYLDAFVEFLEENPEIYGPENYTEVKEEEEEAKEAPTK
ncbi:unnamed protein product [Chironomus riparius]|uniref:Protein male-specific lethal-3 n=1 Tax=Chironomus riparius TaxID=315576 RepID=A0A9N9S5N1_9DIPT|nr:unnamed protein product [Chironomus riparius]